MAATTHGKGAHLFLPTTCCAILISIENPMKEPERGIDKLGIPWAWGSWTLNEVAMGGLGGAGGMRRAPWSPTEDVEPGAKEVAVDVVVGPP